MILKVRNRECILVFHSFSAMKINSKYGKKILEYTKKIDAANESNKKVPLEISFARKIFGILWFYVEIYTWCTATLSRCPRFPVSLSTIVIDRKITIVLYEHNVRS